MRVEQIGDREVRVDGKVIKFERQIDQILAMSDQIIVAFGVFEFPEDDPDAGRNVFAYDRSGKQLWRIEDAKVMRGGRTVDKVSQGCTGLQLKEDGTIHAWVVDWRYDLDPETGEISNPKYFR